MFAGNWLYPALIIIGMIVVCAAMEMLSVVVTSPRAKPQSQQKAA